MRANHFPTESTNVSDALRSRLPRDCQEVTLLLNQGIFLRNRKKKSNWHHFHGNLTDFFNSIFASWKKKYKKNAEDFGSQIKVFIRIVLKSVFQVGFKIKKWYNGVTEYAATIPLASSPNWTSQAHRKFLF